MWRNLWQAVASVLGFAAATATGIVPRRYWSSLDTLIPVSRAALASALATFALAAVIGIPAFFRYAEANAGQAVDLMLQSAGWRATPAGAAVPSQAAGQLAWASSFLWLFTFAFFTPIGLLISYLAVTGFVRAVSVAVDDARGDPVLTTIDAVGRRVWQKAQTRRARMNREQLEGPEVADRLVPGRAAGFPDADLVVVSSRRKADWEKGAVVVTSEKWYRLGVPVERQMRGGLRTLYPLTELRDSEVLRRGVSYELPPLSGSLSKSET